MRDAIILSMLKDGLKSKKELETKLDMQKNITRKSLSFLNNSGLVKKHSINGNVYYGITEDGKRTIDNVINRFSY